MSELPASDQKLQVGQKLWYVPNGKRNRSVEPEEITVSAVGRRWACATIRFSAERIDMQTLRVDGGDYTSPGTCWLSKEAYEAHVALDAAWREFHNLVDRQYMPPPGVTLNQIKNAHRALFKDAK